MAFVCVSFWNLQAFPLRKGQREDVLLTWQPSEECPEAGSADCCVPGCQSHRPRAGEATTDSGRAMSSELSSQEGWLGLSVEFRVTAQPPGKPRR